MCFALQGNQTGFSIQTAWSPLPVSSPLHSSHSPANATFPSPVLPWDSREQPPALTPLSFFLLAPQEGGAGTPLLLRYRQALESQSCLQQWYPGTGTVISTQQRLSSSN